MRDEDDFALVRDCLGGERRAFETLVSRFERPVYNVARRILNDAEEAKDVTQAVFLKVFEGMGSYRPEFRLFSWIYRIAVNESINSLQRARRYVRVAVDDVASEQHDPEAGLMNGERHGEIDRALSQISIDYRTVIVLKHFMGCSYHEMANILDVPEKTVKSRLFTARAQLSELIAAGERRERP